MLKCLVCYSDLPQPIQVKSEIRTVNDDSCPLTQKTILSRHLDVIFILRNIFQVPVTKLSNYLKNYPKVDNWICICEKCNDLVWGYRVIYNDLMDISRKVEEIKQGIIGIVKKSIKSSSETQTIPAFLNITDECRRFINDYDYQWPINPFTGGDLKALQLLDKQNSVSKDEDKPIALSENSRTRSKAKITTTNSITCSYSDDYDDEDPFSNEDDDFEPDTDDSDSDVNEDESTLKSNRNPKKKDPPEPERGKKLSKYQKYKKDTKYECPHCPSKKYVCKATLILHFQNKHPDCTPPPKCKAWGERKCPAKLFTVSKSETLKRNLKSRAPGKCPHCDKQFKNLQHHIELKHLRKYGYHCANCGVGKACKKSVESHEALCSAEGPKEKCPEKDCPVTVSLKMGLETHLRDKHSGRSLFSRCPKCEEGFYSELGLERHLKRKHKDTKPFKCDQCGMGFKSNQKLNNHRRMYHDEGEGGMVKMICELCGAKFSNQRYLTDHVKMQHENEFKLRCEQCGRGYSTEELLKVHLFLKHGVGRVEDMRWRCEVEGCGKVFWKKGPLDLHLSLHHEGVGGKCPEWTCEECGKQFYLKYQLAHHRKRFHESKLDEKFKCDICGVEFKFKHYVTRHKKKVHKIIPQKRR